MTSPRKPDWLKVRAPGGDRYASIKRRMRDLSLHTVCEEARCPNVGECWGGGTATFMILGDVCTRGCRFCAVTTGRPTVTDVEEPARVADAAAHMGLDYVVLTSVNRDDLPDGGSAIFAATVTALFERSPDILVEVLTPDFLGDAVAVQRVLDAGPHVFAHNVETVERLTRRVRDARAGYAQSLAVLTLAKARATRALALTKSSIMVGCGETPDEVMQTLSDLRDAGCDVVTIGQYLRPSPKHLAVERWVTPEEFADYEAAAGALGFVYCASGPLVRSSYRAGEYFLRHRFRSSAA